MNIETSDESGGEGLIGAIKNIIFPNQNISTANESMSSNNNSTNLGSNCPSKKGNGKDNDPVAWVTNLPVVDIVAPMTPHQKTMSNPLVQSIPVG